MMRQRGQAMVLAVMCLGVIMAGVVFFGSSRQKDTAASARMLVGEQAAVEALGLAGKRVQAMYANEAGCDPASLDARLSAIPNLPSDATTLGISFTGGTVSYVTVVPTAVTAAGKAGLCSGGTAGCRQLAVPVNNQVYVVTVGAVSSDSDTVTDAKKAASRDCPRDASVSMSVAFAGDKKKVFVQRVTLTNICSPAACDTSVGGRGFEGTTAGVDFPGTLTLSGSMTTSACTGTFNFNVSRKYGGGFTEASSSALSPQDLRWARRYLETGGEDVGETNFLWTNSVDLNTLDANTVKNGACPPASSSSQCLNRPCFPAFDLNRDGKNNESDLAILENFLRGYITSLPVNELP